MLPYAHTDWCGRLQYQPPSRTVVPYMDAGTGRYGLAKAPADRRAKVTHPCALSGTGSEMALLMLRLRFKLVLRWQTKALGRTTEPMAPQTHAERAERRDDERQKERRCRVGACGWFMVAVLAGVFFLDYLTVRAVRAPPPCPKR